MHHYVVYIAKVTDKGQYIEGKIVLNHLVPPVVEQQDLDTRGILEMALHGVQLTEGGLKNRCDLTLMELIPPNPVAEAIHKLEGE
jgi:hypothetical protein